MKYYWINLFLFLIFLEIGSFILSKFNLLSFNQTPEFYWKEEQVSYSNFFTEKNEWGAWHRPNSMTHHRSRCFKAKYTSNEIGAKDSSFKEIADKKNNIIMLGDSFAEGHGSDNDSDFETLLEKKINRNILNLSSSGDLGPLQYWIIYNKIAKLYNHDKIIIVLATGNDFTDNNFDFWNKNSDSVKNDFFLKRYRPYYLPNDDGTYDYFIPKTALKRDGIAYPQENFTINNLKEFFKKYFWSSNVYRTIKYIFYQKRKLNNIHLNPGSDYSGYFDSNLNDQKAGIFFIEKIIEKSFPREVVLISIPRPNDFFKMESKNKKLENIYWHKYFSDKDVNDTRFTFIDILKFPPKNILDLYFTCDGHLSIFGNKWVAKVIYDQINVK